ncbi:MAG: tRNA (adenosine(37)-N6)-dimethylallyltransferase MiaA [Gemmatimonadota bacterium]
MDVVRLSVICGPTGAGKSALALRLAEAAGAGILSADSRQVYRGFDVGTAKPSAAEQAAVPHAGIDVVEPTERYSAARWMESVDDWRASLASQGRRVLVVGGTGLYLQTLSAPLFAEPPLDPDARAALAGELAPLTLDELRAQCEVLDPVRAHLGRTQLLRAIEVARLTGRPISTWHREQARPARYDVRYLVVDPGDALHAWIARRVDAMLASGWVDEVRALMAALPSDAPAWNTTGYDAIRQVVQGTLSVAHARDQILIATRQYAKRQRTWFRHQLPSDRVDHVNSAAPDAYDRVRAWSGEEEGT